MLKAQEDMTSFRLRGISLVGTALVVVSCGRVSLGWLLDALAQSCVTAQGQLLPVCCTLKAVGNPRY